MGFRGHGGDMGFRGHGTITSPVFRFEMGTWSLGDKGGTWGLGDQISTRPVRNGDMGTWGLGGVRGAWAHGTRGKVTVMIDSCHI